MGLQPQRIFRFPETEAAVYSYVLCAANPGSCLEQSPAAERYEQERNAF
jgi:hypothetical protein